jgi:hypothetical protein
MQRHSKNFPEHTNQGSGLKLSRRELKGKSERKDNPSQLLPFTFFGHDI